MSLFFHKLQWFIAMPFAMKYFKAFFLAFSAVLTCCLAGCETPEQPGNQDPPKPVAVESVSLSSQSLDLKVGESATLTATIKPSDAQATVSWSTSNASVATVSSGKVTAVAEGTATISASAEGKSANCQVTVKASAPAVVEVTSVTLDHHELALKEGESKQLKVSVKPDNATDKTVSWSTSNPAIVTVDKNGNIKAVAEGTATVAAAHGNLSDACKITVTASAIPVTSISLDKTTLTLAEQDTYQLKATVNPDNATDKTVTWSTSNPAVATVSSSGLVTAKAEGSATITAKAGDKSATCEVTVAPNGIPVDAVYLNKSSLSLTENETYQLSVAVTPDNATDKTVTWSTSNAAIATVSDNGLVTAIKEGSATITAKAGDKTATCAVTVSKKVIPVTSVTLNKASLALTEQETFQLSATVSPDNATDKTVTWSSSNTAVATVSNNGLVTAVKEGSATITAKAGDKTATCTVTISKTVVAVTSVTLNKTSLSLMEQDTYQLVATVIPADATDKTVTWTSSNSSVATVDGNGVVKGVAVGSATITAKAGSKTATCAVTITQMIIPVTSITLDYAFYEIARGKVFTLTATVLPDNATNRTVTWSSSNKAVATVDKNGNVTAVKAGTTTITATVGNLSASCVVTVVVPVTSIVLNITSKTLKENETVKLTATVKPTDATDPSVSWASDKPNVATVDNNGNVTAVSEGVATITATAGEMTATCTITVSNTASGGHEGTGTEIWD